jgi:sulfur relay (sulfurtransferase) DsrF/TusC family protein
MVDEEPKVVCGPDGDVCYIDTEALKKEMAQKGAGEPTSAKDSVLFMMTRGTYGRFDDVYGAILVANASLAKQQGATMILINDGIYLAMKGQEPARISLASNLPEISDFHELGGRLLAHRDSVHKRGVENSDLIDGVEFIDDDRIILEIERHSVSLTF